ncbi:hypothetical protein LCI18_010190 [Fusarium solani-melongenae]|uniref:Uncharacterized protein n=1 Tax=Fusarium solani subsp. cucurbitae TaxID=2747967 RepID=A0ACD3ZDH1_FUSSC|nr:hypothetical protein LCI18_010190 [Fusarium solani-melongenae]
MARLNEPPVPTDSLETLRKKLLRQNRDLAKSNNIRALRIRELENDCACMLSENLELRGRILELEKELEDNDARRIADHALAIKAKLESQLTEWGTLLAGLGLEPPMKRHSPRPRKSQQKPRLSFSSARPSPSQRRLRDIAREIEELGHISETKAYPRQSMNPEEILALRSVADDANSPDSVDSPELGPPPMSQFIDQDPVKVDSPSRSRPTPVQESPKTKLSPPEALESPHSNKMMPRSPSPEKKREVVVEPQEPQTETTVPEKKAIETKPLETKDQNPSVADNSSIQPVKTGSKRKFAARDDMGTAKPQKINNENENTRIMAEKPSIREKAGGRTLKELTSMRKEAREKANATGTRKPLAAKSTNDDMTSPKKTSKPVALDEVAAAKADLVKSKVTQDRPKSRSKVLPPITIDAVPDLEPTAPTVTDVSCDLGTPLTQQVLLSPNSPDSAVSTEAGRGGTPPPIDINASREPARPSRRSRAAVSYAEPNLRAKMRRPTKELLDAVAGEGKHARRSSAADLAAPDTVKVKRETDASDSWKKLPPAGSTNAENEPGSIPASPLAGKGSPPELPQSVGVRGGRRPSMMVQGSAVDRVESNEVQDTKEESTPDSTSLSEVDVYDFTPSSPQPEKQAPVEPKKRAAGRRATRRVSAAVHSEEGLAIRERASSRRRSMML